uniref:Metallothionein n=1 Tax=Silene vulgaris TaxID=42043 RepID=T1RUX1_SILVU|nr:metallothionein [Silene vulgaris]AGO67233.1 metallothionein [Silene vulgaris]AGO67236.1 metallothionein 3 [Silene vulgaris]
MSGMCANCDCSDKNNCVKGAAEYDDVDALVVDSGVGMATAYYSGECDSCKCGPSCACASCSCCSH